MSRVGKSIIIVPEKVEVKVTGSEISVTGPKGQLKENLPEILKLNVDNKVLTLEWHGDETMKKSLHGLWRMKIANMVVGVNDGFTMKLDLVGVGYKVQKQGDNLEFALGYSHPIIFKPANGNKLNIEGPTKVIVTGIDKATVGQDAADIRGLRPPEPYKGKGVKYENEIVRRKAGKSGKAGGKK